MTKGEPVGDIGDLAGATTPAASVVIVDNDNALCELIRDRIDDEPGLACVGVATTPASARELVRAARPAVILVDALLERERGLDGIDLVADLVRLSPTSQVLIWTTWTDPSVERADEIRHKLRAERSGASDWVAKGDGIDVLVDRIREAVRRGPSERAAGAENPIAVSIGDLLASHTAAAEQVPGAVDHGLTPAELRAARATAHGLEKGMKIEQVAKTLKISIQTLRAHLRSIYAKWNVHRQAEFVAEARRRGLS